MEEENKAIVIAMIIGATILGIGLAMFFNRPYTGFGAVVLAIGLMTLSLIITMRAEEIIHLKIYPSSDRSRTIAEVSVETSSPTESASPPSTEKHVQEVLEPEESYEVQVEQAPEVLEVEEAQQFQEVEETEESPSMYEYAPPPQEAETTGQEPEEPEEAGFAEPEQEQESSIEAYPASSEQSQET